MPTPKPPGMSWESFSEALIRQAMQQGEFKDVAGIGKPIPSLDEPYRDDWWLKSLLKREEVSLPCTSLDLRVDVERTLARVGKLRSEAVVRKEIELLNARIVRANGTVVSGPATSIAPLDVEAVARRWNLSR